MYVYTKFRAVLFATAQRWKLPRCLSTRDGETHNGPSTPQETVYNNSEQLNENQWIVLGTKGQHQKFKNCIISFYIKLKKWQNYGDGKKKIVMINERRCSIKGDMKDLHRNRLFSTLTTVMGPQTYTSQDCIEVNRCIHTNGNMVNQWNLSVSSNWHQYPGCEIWL